MGRNFPEGHDYSWKLNLTQVLIACDLIIAFGLVDSGVWSIMPTRSSDIWQEKLC